MVQMTKLELGNGCVKHSYYYPNPWEETIGPFLRIWKEECLLIAKIGEVTLILPNELEKALAPLVGTTISILRTDLPKKEWLIRVIPDSGKKTEPTVDQNRCGNEQASSSCEVV